MGVRGDAGVRSGVGVRGGVGVGRGLVWVTSSGCEGDVVDGVVCMWVY